MLNTVLIGLVGLGVIYLIKRTNDMSTAVDSLITDIDNLTSAVDGAVKIIDRIPEITAAAVREALQDEDLEDAEVEAKVEAARSSVQTQTQALKDAMLRNTGESGPAPAPTPEPVA